MVDISPGYPTTARSWRNAYNYMVSDTGKGTEFCRGFVDCGPGNIRILCTSDIGGRECDSIYPI